MLQWVTQQLMEIEAANKVGVEKGKHSRERNTYFSGYRVRRFDTRLGTAYLCVPKLRNGGYIPFFVVERKRSEQALIQVVQEAFVNGIRRRSRVVGIFPSVESYVRLVTSFLIEYSEEWSISRSYIKVESIDRCRARLGTAA
jgi:transposase-like protein